MENEMDKILKEMHGHLDELCMVAMASKESEEIMDKVLEDFTKLARLNEALKQNIKQR